MTRWYYQGDNNLEHGGTFFDLSDWKHGYVNIVEVTDLDSAIGFAGAMLIEARTVSVDDKRRWSESLGVIGATLEDNDDINDNGRAHYRKGSKAWRMCLVYALSVYGYYDTERSEAVQPERDCPVKYDGWEATRIRSLRSYVRREFLGLA